MMKISGRSQCDDHDHEIKKRCDRNAVKHLEEGVASKENPGFVSSQAGRVGVVERTPDLKEDRSGDLNADCNEE